MVPKGAKFPLTPQRLAASRANLRKAWQANRTRWALTPARLASARRTIKLAHEAIRRRPRKLSPAQLRAARSNVAKARAALQARGRTPEHLAKLRQTVARARATRTPESARRQAEKVLKHGLFARSVRHTMRPLGEDPKEFDKHLRLLRQFFGPQDNREEDIIRGVAEAIRRRMRLWRAEAHWESEFLEQCLGLAEPLTTPDPDQTLHRALLLMGAVLSQDRLFERDRRLVATIERVLRQLVRKRSDGRHDLKVFAREVRRPPDEDAVEIARLKIHARVSKGLIEGGPEVEAILDRLRPDWMRK